MSIENQIYELLQLILRKSNAQDVKIDKILAAIDAEAVVLQQIQDDLQPEPELSSIQIAFTAPSTLKGALSAMPTPGPITLIFAGQTSVASVVGFDQFGAPWTGPMPVATLSSDDAAGAIVTFDPTTGLTTAVANGVANISGSLTTLEGKALSDTEAVTVAIPIVPPPPPVLSSIKVAFDTPSTPPLTPAKK